MTAETVAKTFVEERAFVPRSCSHSARAWCGFSADGACCVPAWRARRALTRCAPCASTQRQPVPAASVLRRWSAIFSRSTCRPRRPSPVPVPAAGAKIAVTEAAGCGYYAKTRAATSGTCSCSAASSSSHRAVMDFLVVYVPFL